MFQIIIMSTKLHNQVGRQQTAKLSDEEQKRQLEELKHLTDEDVQQRVAMASKLLQLHKEMLLVREPTKVRKLLIASSYTCIFHYTILIVNCMCTNTSSII